MSNEKSYYMYVLLTENNSLYCGYTDDVERRFAKHQKGDGAKYTKLHKPVSVVFKQKFDTKSEAMKAEYKFKKLSRKYKLAVINGYFNLEEL